MWKNVYSRAVLYSNKAIRLNKPRFADLTKNVHCNVCLMNPRHTSKSNTTTPAISTKYEVITEDNSPIIENTDQEIMSYSESVDKYPLLSDEYDDINLERGKNGVFEIEDLVELLKRENTKDIFVVSVPKEINYVSYICIVSARSKRHTTALAEFVKKVYKKKRYESDAIPRIEGKDSEGWVALDLGNIALHIFSEKDRKMYDLETLWSVGPEFDEQTKNKDKIVDIIGNYSAYLKDLKPLE